MDNYRTRSRNLLDMALLPDNHVPVLQYDNERDYIFGTLDDAFQKLDDAYFREKHKEEKFQDTDAAVFRELSVLAGIDRPDYFENLKNKIKTLTTLLEQATKELSSLNLEFEILRHECKKQER